MTIKDIVAIAFGLGLLANAALFVPQAVRIFRSKHAKDVSLVTFAGFNLLQVIGICHGALQRDPSLLIGMTASFLACGAVTAGALVYRHR